MSDGVNMVMLLGNLGADPELRYTQGGQAVLNMRLATTESYLDKDKVRRERTDWHNVVMWGKRGEALSKILGKGSSVFIQGSLRTSSYDNREGVKVYKTEVIAQDLKLTGKRAGGDEAGNETREPQDQGQAPGQARGNGGGRNGQGGQTRGGYGGGGGYGGSSGRGNAQAPAGAAAQPPAHDEPDYDGTGGYGGGSDDDIPF